MTRWIPSAVLARLSAVAMLLLLGGCAARTVPPPPLDALQYPDFVFPAVTGAADPGTVSRQQAGWRWLQVGDLRNAEREFAAVLKNAPQFAPAASGLAYVSLARRQAAEALTRFDRALQQVPGYAPALAGRGLALLALGRDADALASLEAAAAADPSLDLGPRIEVLRFRGAQDHVTSARRAAERGRLDEAREAYAQALAASPDSPFLHRELGVVESRAARYDDALEHLRKAAALDPSDARAHALIGDLLLAREDLDGAERAFAAAHAIDPSPEIAAKLESTRARAELLRLPEEYRAIPGAPEVTRADVAAALGVRLGELLAPASTRMGVLVTDVRTHWAAQWILSVVRAGVMEPLPNHTFQPRQRVRRGELAQITNRVLELIAAHRPAAAAEWRATRLEIADLAPTHPTYPAVAQVVAAGVLSLSGDAFDPARPVTGAELTAAVARLEALAGPLVSQRR